MEKIKNHLNSFGGLKFENINLSKIFPHRDWKIIIMFFVIFLSFGLFFDYQIYIITENGGFYVDTDSNSVRSERLNTNGINNIIKSFEDKSIRMKSLEKSILVDPSI